MQKETIPTLPTRKGCTHKNSDPLYLRGDKSWTSTQKVLGYMVFGCYDCGSFFKKESNKVELNDALRKKDEVKE